MRSACGNGRGLSRTPLKMLNTALVTPMPRAKARTASAVTNRARVSVRTANRRSCTRVDMPPPPVFDGIDISGVDLAIRNKEWRQVAGVGLPRRRRHGREVAEVAGH